MVRLHRWISSPGIALYWCALTIRSSRDRFAAAELFGKLSRRRGRKALRLNSGVMRGQTEKRLIGLIAVALTRLFRTS